jgi:hypothetical protein
VHFALDQDGAAHLSSLKDGVGAVTYATNRSGKWVAETIADGEYIEDSVGVLLAIASDGTPCVAYDLDADLTFACRGDGAWAPELVDEWHSFDSASALVLDGGDVPHLVYAISDGEGCVLHSYRSGDGWISEALLDTAGSVHGLAAAIMDDGRVATLISQYGQRELDYLVKEDGVLTTTVVSTGGVYNFPALGFATDGSPIAAAVDVINDRLMRYTSDGATWGSRQVDWGLSTGKNPALRLDSAGRVQVAFSDVGIYDDAEDGGLLRLATRDADGWSYREIGLPGESGVGPSLLIDDSDRPHVAYWDLVQQRLRYAVDNGDGWEVETVPSPPPPGGVVQPYRRSSLAFTPDGRPAVAACSPDAEISYFWLGTLMYAEKTDQWATELIGASTFLSDCDVALRFEDNGAPGIAYSELDVGIYGAIAGMSYWVPAGQTWSGEFLDTAADASAYSAAANGLAVDSHGATYVNFDVNGLRVAVRGPGADEWDLHTVPWDSRFETNTLALDPDDRPHVAFNTQLAGCVEPHDCEIRLVSAIDTQWVHTLVDYGGLMGSGGLDLQIDAEGMVHMVYEGEDALWYARFPVASLGGK